MNKSILYIDCSTGVAGDMLTAALMDLLPDKQEFVDSFNAIGIPGVVMSAETKLVHGISGNHVTIKVNGIEEGEHVHTHIRACDDANARAAEHTHSHEHRSLEDIKGIVKQLACSEGVRDNILSVYQMIARAESEVHGTTVEQVHFHEVGMLDAVADVAAVSMLMEILRPQHVGASALNLGSGRVKCAHGILPVPAPATAKLLCGVPAYMSDFTGELTTPTGAALVKKFADSFGNMPQMVTSAVGYGMGNKDFGQATFVRAFLGEYI